MKVTTTRRVTHTLQVDDDTALEIQHEPIDNTILVERVGDKIVVAYLVQDDRQGSNPMEDYSCNGKLIVGNDRCEQPKVYAELGLDSYGNVDYDEDVMIGGKQTTLREYAATVKPGETFEEIEERADALYRMHWQSLHPWAVPVRYDDYGSSGCRIYIDNWLGNPDKPPNAVWVADKDARENLEFEGKVPTQEEINDYAKGVIEEYEKWCNGEVYGCVVEIHQEVSDNPFTAKDGVHWERLPDEDSDNSCWGFIGFENAQQALQSEFFKPAIEEAKGN